jgi:hypothetical protein
MNARRKPQNSGLLINNSSSIPGVGGKLKDGEQKSSSITDETEKERELKLEISRLYRQIEEMRSLSMRIANPHLIPKKHRFGYQTKKKTNKNKNNPNNMASEHEISRIYSSYEPEQQSLVVPEPSIISEKPSSIQLNKNKRT